jgi:diaminohydroxyphosphoribosylaminopyrimidine deaminase/5-amino-6-(5-phosphoribosylamino)uracil reductase
MTETLQLSALVYLKQALDLARQRRGFCAPNPAVGAVVVKNAQVISTGTHWAAGFPHAEVEALQSLTPEQSRDAEIYVTLEPCSHHGRTPPCTQLLIEKGIKAVYYAYQDPNPLVSGRRGAQQLLAAGIPCQHTPLSEITHFYQSYLHWTQHKRPWVTAKLAISLNGKIADAQGQPLAITGKILNEYTHQQRKQADAILTTCKTIRCDDPKLNARIDGQAYRKSIYVLDSGLNFPPHAQLLTTAANITLFYTDNAPLNRRLALESKGIRCMPIKQEHDNICLNEVLMAIGKDGVHDLWVEAGGECFQAFIAQRLVQRALVYVAPKWLSSDAQSAFHTPLDLSQLGHIQWQSMGNDMMCEVLCSPV